MLNKLLIIFLKLYQYILSPFLGPSCRFQPTCSQYGINALREYSFFTAIKLTAKRICKCHPWSKFTGYDPVPEKRKC